MKQPSKKTPAFLGTFQGAGAGCESRFLFSDRRKSSFWQNAKVIALPQNHSGNFFLA